MMENPTTPKSAALVVSRSGRVLKKSTKLIDFTSPDDIDNAKVKKSLLASSSKKLNMTQLTHIKMEPEVEMTHVLAYPRQIYDDNYIEEDTFTIHEKRQGIESDDDEDESLASDLDEKDLLVRVEDDPEIEFTTPRRSIYMTEKSTKRFTKDGKVVVGKAQRKDKGKTRYTAYMLWARETRPSIQNSNPELDFASISKKLGEMWGNVPANLKYNWKRRAKRLGNKMKKTGNNVKSQQPSKYIQQKYLNKNSTNVPSNTKNNNNTSNNQSSATSPLTKQQKQLQKLIKSEKTKKQSIQNVQKQQKELTRSPVKKIQHDVVPASTSKALQISPGLPNRNLNKPLDLAPIDVAAHMKLLGESLINIGERLKEHEGQIAVSGSLSVLLDSILCAMGSLMVCLTYVPRLNLTKEITPPNGSRNDGANDDEQVKQLFHNIMNNIHYIMPGL